MGNFFFILAFFFFLIFIYCCRSNDEDEGIDTVDCSNTTTGSSLPSDSPNSEDVLPNSIPPSEGIPHPNPHRNFPRSISMTSSSNELTYREFRRERYGGEPSAGACSIKRQLSMESEKELLNNLNKVKTYLQVKKKKLLNNLNKGNL